MLVCFLFLFAAYNCRNHHHVFSSSSSLSSSSVASSFASVVILESTDYPHISRQLGEELKIPVVSSDPADGNDLLVALPKATTHALVVLTNQDHDDNDDYCLGLCSIQNPLKQQEKRRRIRRQQQQQQPQVLSKPFIVNIGSDRHSSSRRGSNGGGGADLLIRAVQPRGKIVYDLTAGWGRDAMVLASSNGGGAKHVYMMERNPIVHALLRDALRRLQIHDTKIETISTTTTNDNESMNDSTSSGKGSTTTATHTVSQCLSLLECQDAIPFLKKVLLQMKNNQHTPLLPRPDVIYLDPMFPIRQKSASVKKDMQLLHGLLGSQQPRQRKSSTLPAVVVKEGDEVEESNEENPRTFMGHRQPQPPLLCQTSEAEEEQQEDEPRLLLQLALQVAKSRVVVKRPRIADPILSSPTLFHVGGTNSRWDVYTIHTYPPDRMK
jgi:hypothetical protein